MSDAATLEGYDLLASGKVREIYEAGPDRLLMVASDRISTYDVVHPTPIPGKGQVLTGLSVFWFERTGHICPNHLVSYTDVPETQRGRALIEELRRLSIENYSPAAEHARERRIILADTKFEFGRDSQGRIVLGDEVLTPDSSRFWPADEYEPGRGQPSFDKQYVRDWAAGSGWDKTPPAPAIPDDVVDGTRRRYEEAYGRITGEPFSAWLEKAGAQA